MRSASSPPECFLKWNLSCIGYYRKMGLHGQINLENARVNKTKRACLPEDIQSSSYSTIHVSSMVHGRELCTWPFGIVLIRTSFTLLSSAPQNSLGKALLAAVHLIDTEEAGLLRFHRDFSGALFGGPCCLYPPPQLTPLLPSLCLFEKAVQSARIDIFCLAF